MSLGAAAAAAGIGSVIGSVIGDLSEEDISEIFAEQQLDTFRNDPIYQAAWEHGNFGDDINEATFEDFADMKDFITDSIYATDSGGGPGSSGSSGAGYDKPEVFNRNPIDDAYPSYVDISPFFKEWTPPRMYTEPADVQMPEVLNDYISTNRDSKVAPRYLTPLRDVPYVDEYTYSKPLPGGAGGVGPDDIWLDHRQEHGEEIYRQDGGVRTQIDSRYPVDYEGSGMLGGLDDMTPAHGNQWREVYDKNDFTEMHRGKIKPTNFASKALEQIGMKDDDEGYAALDKWMQIAHKDPIWEGASGFDLNSTADLDKFKEITKKYNFTLPEGPTWSDWDNNSIN